MAYHVSVRSILLLALLAGSVLALAGCVDQTSDQDVGVLPPTTEVGTSPTAEEPSEPAPSPATTSPDGVKQFDVDISAEGFRVHDGKELRVKVGDSVKVVFHHKDSRGDDHPIFFTCTNRVATSTATGGPVAMSFVAKKAGTCAFFCTNGDCGPHQVLQNGKLFVEA